MPVDATRRATGRPQSGLEGPDRDLFLSLRPQFFGLADLVHDTNKMIIVSADHPCVFAFQLQLFSENALKIQLLFLAIDKLVLFKEISELA